MVLTRAEVRREYSLSLADVERLAGEGNLIPIYRELLADLETPVSAFLKIAAGQYSFLLESVEGGERLARYSFIGVDPYLVVRSDGRTDPLRLVEAELSQHRYVAVPGLPRFTGGAVGFLSYDAIRHYEPVPPAGRDPVGLPEAIFLFTDTLLVFDHLKHSIKVLSHVHVNGNVARAYREATERIESLAERLGINGRKRRRLATRSFRPAGSIAGDVTSNITQAQFEEMVRRGKQYIFDGHVIQVVLSQRLSKATTASPFGIYRALRAVNPSPYMYFLQLDRLHIVGASPELLVRVEGETVETHPIAGTRPRGRTPEEDAANEVELRNDEKERAEHVMLVDLGRNDVGRVSRPGTVEVSQLLEVERYSHVMHLVSHVSGKLRPDHSPVDALRACFPAGTVSGAPKIRAMQIISELEPDRRGPYAGAVGYLSYSGNLDTAITIRTILLQDGVAHIQAGAGIVADSVPEREYQETLAKARALMRAIEEAEGRE